MSLRRLKLRSLPNIYHSATISRSRRLSWLLILFIFFIYAIYFYDAKNQAAEEIYTQNKIEDLIRENGKFFFCYPWTQNTNNEPGNVWQTFWKIATKRHHLSLLLAMICIETRKKNNYSFTTICIQLNNNSIITIQLFQMMGLLSGKISLSALGLEIMDPYLFFGLSEL